MDVLLLGPLVVVEGPAATLTAGALVGAGTWAFWPVWFTVLGAELVADSVLYVLGRLGTHRRVAPVLGRLGLTEARRGRWATRPLGRTVLLAKAVDVFAIPAFLTVGLARTPYRRFLGWVTAGAALRAALLLGLGATAGRHVPPLAVLAAGLVLAGGYHILRRRSS